MDIQEFTPSEIEILRLVSKEWTRDKYARAFAADKAGNGLKGDIQSPRAEQWCLQGYVAKLMGIHTPEDFWCTNLYEKMRKSVHSFSRFYHLSELNDTGGHAEVLLFLFKLIEGSEYLDNSLTPNDAVVTTENYEDFVERLFSEMNCV